jgi:hypothetical protein
VPVKSCIEKRSSEQRGGNGEEQMRVFWRRWKALLNGAEAKPPGEDTHGAGGTAIAAQ